MVLTNRQQQEFSSFVMKWQGKHPTPEELGEEAAKIGALWVADACRDAAMTWQGHEPHYAGQAQFLAGQIERAHGALDRQRDNA